MKAYRIIKVGDKYKIDKIDKENEVMEPNELAYQHDLCYSEREILEAVELGLAVVPGMKGGRVLDDLEDEIPEKKIIVRNPYLEVNGTLSFSMYKYKDKYFGVLEFSITYSEKPVLLIHFYDSKENFEKAFERILEKFNNSDNPLTEVLVCEKKRRPS